MSHTEFQIYSPDRLPTSLIVPPTDFSVDGDTPQLAMLKGKNSEGVEGVDSHLWLFSFIHSPVISLSNYT